MTDEPQATQAPDPQQEATTEAPTKAPTESQAPAAATIVAGADQNGTTAAEEAGTDLAADDLAGAVDALSPVPLPPEAHAMFKAMFRANIDWLRKELDMHRLGMSHEERAEANP